MDVLPASSFDMFDPVSVLVEDAVSSEPPELVYDFIDRLLTSQQPPPLKEGHAPSAPIPITQPHERHAASGYGKRHKRFEQPSVVVGSPVSTMEISTELDYMPVEKLASPSSSSEGSPRGERSPPRSSGGGGNSVGLSRKNRPQRCSICKECGHKSRTCRFAQGKVDLRPGSPASFGSVALQTATY